LRASECVLIARSLVVSHEKQLAHGPEAMGVTSVTGFPTERDWARPCVVTVQNPVHFGQRS